MIEKGDKIVKNSRKTQHKTKIIMKKIDEPEVFRNYFESYPLSENWILRGESFYNESKGIPIASIN